MKTKEDYMRETGMLDAMIHLHQWHKKLVQKGIVKFEPKGSVVFVYVNDVWVTSVTKHSSIAKIDTLQAVFSTINAMEYAQMRGVENESNQ